MLITPQTIKVEIDNQSTGSKPKQAQRERLGVFLIITFFALLLMAWLILDHRLPANDEAGHILNSYTYADLLRHPKFWRSEWLYKFLTVNQFYPPTIHIFNGVLRLLVGSGRQADIISLVIFNLILSISIYGISRLLTSSWLAGILAVICVNTYPNLNFLSHQYLLDYPLVAMTSLGLFTLVWWRQTPSVKRALISGIAIGAVCMSKQIAACYLALPAFVYFVQATKSDWRQRQIHQTRQLLIIALVVSIICLPWLSLNAGSTHKTTSELASQISLAVSAPTFFSNIAFYLTALPQMMSAPLFMLFLLSLLMPAYRMRLLPAGLSALGGILLVSSLTWLFPKEQYLAPLLTPCAIYSAAGLTTMLKAQSHWLKLTAACLIAFAPVQFFVANFTPYPLQISKLPGKLSNYLSRAYPNHPNPPEDWGQEWVIKQIDRIDKKQATWLNILSDTPEINGHTFEFVAARLGSPVKPTTSRYYTILGDRLEFSDKQALYCQWYLFRSGDKGFPLKDASSKLNYLRLINFVRNGGHFYLVGEKLLPDRTVLSLYRQK